MAKSTALGARLSEELREFALGLPGAFEDFPWGERVIKVNKKVFVFLGKPDEERGTGFGMSVKLPVSNSIALGLPFTEPTGYGLGKGGWVSVRFEPGQAAPVEMFKEWILESYRAIAPKKLSAQLDAAPPAPVVHAKARPAPAKRPAKR
jgi:predicted DNA-binding protein (MmcQ/YjbR family)